MAAEEVDVDIEGDESELNLSDINGGTSGFLQDHYLQSAWGPSPGVIPWTLDSSISNENRVIIENMLLEEEYYLTGKQLPQNLWTRDKQGNEKVKRSPVKSSTFPIRWTQEEKDIFEKGLAQFGRRWTKIAKLISSRSVLQVKGYARQYFKTKAKTDNPSKDGSSQEIPCVSSGDGSGSESHPASFCEAQAAAHLNTVRIERLSDDEDVDITDDADGGARLQLSDVDGETQEEGSAHTASCVEAEEVQPSSVTVPTSAVEPETSSAYYEVHDAVGGQLSGLTPTAACKGQATLSVELDSGPSSDCISSKEGADPLVLNPVTPDEENEADRVFVQSLPEHESSEGTAQSEQVPGTDYESPEEEEEEEEEEMLKPPEEEVEMDRSAIIEEEKQAISEFFEGRSSKTPERYLKIRNYILDQWEKCKPKYLNKTSVRPGLKNCGDVNCIGRIHTYLELIGAINFGCEQAIYNRPRLVDKTRFKEGKDTMEAYQLAQRLQSMRTRKRRVRDVWGNWRDARDLEGQTYEHLTAEELAKRREEDKKRLPKPPKVPRQAKKVLKLIKKLVLAAHRSLGSDLEEHAHVSMAEVIGLLGGVYSEGERVLEICVAEPCNSLSTGLQCEMDPVSQTQASEALARRGYSVVGWYHSHPAFDPNPSLRDIDTQAKFQSYFSRGGAQFIGMIVSPYNPTNTSPHSQVTCLIVSQDLCSAGAHGLPFKFEIQQSLQEPQWPLVLKKAEWIIDKYRLSRGCRKDRSTHLTAEELAKRREEDKKRLPKPPKVPRQAKNSFDPFQLIPCQAFGDEKQEPFQVRVSGEALVVMDMHAHVSMAEVIGLLGGVYSEGERVLEICVAEPCNSLSTGLQCEMDPVSQTQASEALARRGYSVVGWYHSHPAFDPNPSLRDIDTQAKFQSYFSRGGAQFIGMIVSPYNPTNTSPHSQVTCLIVSQDLCSAGAHGLPFKFEIQQSLQEPQWPLVLKKAEWIIDKYRLSRGSVPMDRIFRRDSNLSCLEKMLASMRNSLGSLCNGTATEGFLAQIETLFLDTFAAENRNSAVLGAEESETMCPFEQTSV